MPLDDIELNLDLCLKHIVETNSDVQIRDFLTKFMLIHISGEYDKEIKRTVSKRVTQVDDVELLSFIDETVNKNRNFKISDIKNLLNKFDSRRGTLFDSWTKDTEKATKYSNIITNRNQGAHGKSINMPLEEIIDAHKLAKGVIKDFQNALYYPLS